MIAVTGWGQSYPSEAVVEYLNLDAAEIARQQRFGSEKLVEIAPVILPEGRWKENAPQSHLGWPHSVIIDDVIVVSFRTMGPKSGLIRSIDGGQTWEDPVFIENAPIVVSGRTHSGKIVSAATDGAKDNTLNVLVSADKGKTWKRHSASVDTPPHLAARIVEHPKFGLITGGHFSADTLTFLVSGDEGETWRRVDFPTAIPVKSNGTVVFLTGGNKLGVFVRNHAGPGPWQPFAQFSPVNEDRAARFEDLKWKGAVTNIWMRKADTSDAIFNPVTGRIEAVTTKRDWGFPQTDRGYMTLNLWSISPEAFAEGSNNWRYEGTLLRCKGEKARVKNPRDGLHPVSTVIDEARGLQHIFIYAGDRAHGGDGAPPTGRTGIFRISRTLDTKAWVAKNREVDNYKEVYQLAEEFETLDRWETSGSPAGKMTLPRTEPPYRTDIKLPKGTLKADGGVLYLRTEEPGYYGLHHNDVIATRNFRISFRAKIERFPRTGYALGIHTSAGAEKYDMALRQDGIYELDEGNPERQRKIIDLSIDNQWHLWEIETKLGRSRIYRDGIYVGGGQSRVDGGIGQRPISISSLAKDKDTPAELRLEYFRFGNIEVPDDASFTNSVGMEVVRIPAGEFRMGNDGEIDYTQVATDAVHASYIRKGGANPHIKNGPPMAANPLEWDEAPSHQTRITSAYYMASKPVTNEQYERFRPEHRAIRGKRGYSHGDDDAVLYVSWHDAIAYTKWLSEKEGRPYRLPTEAEWEYAARAGTTTPYFTGDSLPQAYRHHQVMNRSHVLAPEKVNLEVGKTPPNAWGLFDMHGLVEEWCTDWYGPYAADADIDPVGPADGVARVTRGGSHSTGLPFLRSANRSGALPETSHFLIGFRVVMGDMPETRPSEKAITRQWATNVNQSDCNWSASKVSKKKPVFREPKTYTRIPPDANGPMYFIHNHNPALSVLPNGDLLAVWFTTVKERGREMLVAAARLRKGEDEWDPADIFFNVPDRNQTGQALWWDGNKTIYHLSGVGTADHWRDLSLVMRTSTDNGVTWSRPEIIGPEYGPRQQPIDAVIGTSKGEIILACDAGADRGGSVIHISRDHGQTWIDPGQNMPEPKFIEGGTGAWIAGIHACIAELKDGSLLAFGRDNDIGGRMPKSISKDGGKTWTYSASDFEPIGSAQRASMIRLNEGPLMIVSFSQSLKQTDAAGNTFTGTGMYAALSYDEGRTWPVRKLITDGQRRVLDAPANKRWGEEFGTLDYNRAEGRGYLTAAQAPDGMIHVLSSGTHYSFNLAWIEAHFPARSTKSK